MKLLVNVVAAALFCIPLVSKACDVTLSSGADLRSTAAAYAGRKICLNAGTYNLGAANLGLAAGTTIEGLAPSRDSVVINSSAQRAIVVSNNVTLKNFLLTGAGPASEFGILTYYNSNVLIWGLRVQNFVINIGVNGSSRVDIWDTFMRYNGRPSNNSAEPNLWITDATNVTVLYGEATGRADGPGGDGEVAAYNSTNVNIDGLHVVDSGASAIYYVNCDSCKISNTEIHRAGEWGLDVVSGSDNFQASGNRVLWSNFGGSVFDEAGSVGGTFTGNTFYQNRRMGVGACNGINVIGFVAGVAQSGNTANPTGVICKYQ